jgi:hypothetical protein
VQALSCFDGGFLFCNYSKAKELLPHQLHPFRYINGKGVFMATVIDYRDTTIGKYIEYSMHSHAQEEQNRHRQCFRLYL